MSSVPPSPGYFSDDPVLHGMAPGPRPGGGLVKQVRVVVYLNAAEGALELMVAFFCIFGALIMWVAPEEIRRQGGANPELVSGMYITLGSVHLLLGALRLVACWRNYFFQNRILGVVSMCAGLISTFAGCCAITSIGVAVYGLIVFFDAAVIDAFERRAHGASVDDVLGIATPRRTE